MFLPKSIIVKCFLFSYNLEPLPIICKYNAKDFVALFKKIVSIEIEPDFVEIVNNKFVKSGDYPDVEFQFHLGDSKSVIPNIIHDIDEKITFWLDGHEFYQIPLLEELIAIKNHKIKDHIIMIDDVRMFDSPEWNIIGHDNVIKLIMDINKSYKITYHNSPHGINDILIAKV